MQVPQSIKKLPLLIATSFLIPASLYADQIEWRFTGVTSASSVYNGSSIGDLPFELRIFVDTRIEGVPAGGDVFFYGPFFGEAKIGTSNFLAVNPFRSVEYFRGAGGDATGVQFTQDELSYILFDSSISGDPLHLGFVAPTGAPTQTNNFKFFGPDDLYVSVVSDPLTNKPESGEVTNFAAFAPPTTVPEGGSTLLFLTSGLAALSFVRRRTRKGSVP